MAFVSTGAGAPDYAPCRYGASKLMFRGPERSLQGHYLAVIGGSETFGTYVSTPFADHLEAGLGVPVVNLGVSNAGPDVFLGDQEIGRIATAAQAVVVQVLGAHNQTNPYYTVHPRRNDRLLGVTGALRVLYPEVDFTEFHFTRHLLQTLQGVSRSRFRQVVGVLQALWVDRMTLLLPRLGARTVLLWTGSQSPMENATRQFGPLYPAFVDAAMMAAIAPLAARHIVATLPLDWPTADDAMNHLAQDAGLPGIKAHRSIADALLPVLRDLGRDGQ
jgi:hypothetical protein